MTCCQEPAMHTVPVRLGERSYDIAIVSEDNGGLGPFARERSAGARAFLVTDEHLTPHVPPLVASLESVSFEVSVVVLPPGEAQMSLASASPLCARLADLRADRKTLVVALGGGVIGDL